MRKPQLTKARVQRTLGVTSLRMLSHSLIKDH
jgi:hypothetical protein